MFPYPVKYIHPVAGVCCLVNPPDIPMISWWLGGLQPPDRRKTLTVDEEMTFYYTLLQPSKPQSWWWWSPPVCGVRALAGMAGRVRARTGDEAEEEECQHSVLSRWTHARPPTPTPTPHCNTSNCKHSKYPLGSELEVLSEFFEGSSLCGVLEICPGWLLVWPGNKKQTPSYAGNSPSPTPELRMTDQEDQSPG